MSKNISTPAMIPAILKKDSLFHTSNAACSLRRISSCKLLLLRRGAEVPLPDSTSGSESLIFLAQPS